MKKIAVLIFPSLFLFAVPSCSSGGQTVQESEDSEPPQLKIAYNVLLYPDADDYEIFIMNTDGTEQKNISNWKGVDWVYHASGGKLYFVSDRDSSYRKYHLYEMDVDGKNIRQITGFLLEDSWLSSRKEGKELIVNSKKEGKDAFYLIDQEGKEIRKVLEAPHAINDPCFSPDGKRIAYRSAASGIDELWIMDLESGRQNQLTRYPESDTTGGQHFYHAGPPSWEPNYNLISYASRQNGNYSIFLINPDGREQRQLSPDGFDEIYHCWSPDGRLITFDGKPVTGANYDIYLMNADGSDVKRLTKDTLYEGGPVFVEGR